MCWLINFEYDFEPVHYCLFIKRSLNIGLNVKNISLIKLITFIVLLSQFLFGCDEKKSNPEAPAEPAISTVPSAVDEFDDPEWETNKGTSFWQQASWMQNDTQMDVDRCQANNGCLELTVLPGTPYRGGSIQTRNDKWSYGRWEASLKPSPVRGVLNSMFTDDWNGKSYEEVDIEFLTRTFGKDKGSVHLALHEDGKTNYWWEDVLLAFNPSDTFHVWAIQILPDSVSWFVDRQLLRTFVYNDEFSLTAPYQFFFNAWTKEEWINGPPATRAVYLIDWVRFYPWNGP